MAIETARRSAALDRILDRLEQGPATNIELNAIAFRFGARIFELRAAGYVIQREQLGRGKFLYTLISRPAAVAA
jgi:hypothetical protein